MTASPLLELRPLSAAENPDDLAAKLAAGFGGDAAPAREFIVQTQGLLTREPRPEPWGAYIAWDGETPIGTCAFKWAPDPAGTVEIAYMTFPAFERRGYAGAMIAALFGVALRGGAKTVIAHTLPEENPSSRALKRNGFAWEGEVVDPEDGPVWRWSRPSAS
jgi:ribosomal-protein-alanine N-acetyltransferase